MAEVNVLSAKINERFSAWIESTSVACGELTLLVKPEHLRELCLILRDDPDFDFKLLIDICGVDYLHYGCSEWQTESATITGFGRGVMSELPSTPSQKPRFAAVYHLLSITHNQRLRLRVYLRHEPPLVDSVADIWPAANWYEREAFDLFGLLFKGHPDLRRILTDYGFAGHPFRKDFPLIGKVEARYDAKQQAVVYETVSITPRVLGPKVIRHDNRYRGTEGESATT